MQRLLLIAALFVAACAPSPLYVGKRAVGTGGEIPRDGNGNPIWSAIPPQPANAVPVVAPPQGAGGTR